MTPACNGVPDELAAQAPTTCPSCSYIAGAAVAFGLIGMAEAIRISDDYRREHTCHWCKLVDHGGAGRCPKAPECPF